MIEDQHDITIPSPRLRVLRLALVVLGLGMLIGSSVYLLGGSTPPAQGAMAPAERLEAQEGLLDVSEQGSPALSFGEALAEMDPVALHDGLTWLAASLQPTATPTPVPPTPAPVVFNSPPPYVPPPAPINPPASQPAAPVVPAAGCPTASMGGYGLALFNAINNARVQNGMGALAADGCAVYVAQVRSNDMASRGYFSHTSPDGSSAFSLLDAYGVPHGWAGENLARNNYPDSETVAVAIRDLMASAPHRANILSGNYSALGVAAVNDGAGMIYYTMVFIGPP